MMPDGLTEDTAREWIDQGLRWWEHGLARFAITAAASDRCIGQIGI
jgi:hypothetical protein